MAGSGPGTGGSRLPCQEESETVRCQGGYRGAAIAGIEQKTIGNSAAYIKSWLKALKNDKKMLVMAAAQGQKAADYILNRKEDQIELDEAA